MTCFSRQLSTCKVFSKQTWQLLTVSFFISNWSSNSNWLATNFALFRCLFIFFSISAWFFLILRKRKIILTVRITFDQILLCYKTGTAVQGGRGIQAPSPNILKFKRVSKKKSRLPPNIETVMWPPNLKVAPRSLYDWINRKMTKTGHSSSDKDLRENLYFQDLVRKIARVAWSNGSIIFFHVFII